MDIYEPEKEEMAEGTTYEDLPNRKGKIKRTSSTDYCKVAKALGDIQNRGIKVSLVDINKSGFGFEPDVENNQILFGLKAMLNISDDTVSTIIANRPYASPQDFLEKVNPSKQIMVSLIKGGAFDNMMDRMECMKWYIWETCDKKKRITLQNMGGLSKYNLLPNDTELEKTAYKVYEFNRYLKAICKKDNLTYKLDDRAINFLQEIGNDNLFDKDFCVKISSWETVYQKWMDVFRKWMATNQEKILNNLNNIIFKEDWDKYAAGNLSSWEMEVLCFYYHKHELAHVNTDLYGLKNFKDLPEEPEVEKSFKRGQYEVKIFKLSKICGTCIAKNKNKSIVSILTTTGVVNIKLRKELFCFFDKQISEKNVEGVKKTLEKSWFGRGEMIVAQGFRSGDMFVAKKYGANSHQLYKINKVKENGELVLSSERVGNFE